MFCDQTTEPLTQINSRGSRKLIQEGHLWLKNENAYTGGQSLVSALAYNSVSQQKARNQ